MCRVEQKTAIRKVPEVQERDSADERDEYGNAKRVRVVGERDERYTTYSCGACGDEIDPRYRTREAYERRNRGFLVGAIIVLFVVAVVLLPMAGRLSRRLPPSGRPGAESAAMIGANATVTYPLGCKVHAAPTENSRVRLWAQRGVAYSVLEVQERWRKIRVGNVEGWANCDAR